MKRSTRENIGVVELVGFGVLSPLTTIIFPLWGGGQLRERERLLGYVHVEGGGKNRKVIVVKEGGCYNYWCWLMGKKNNGEREPFVAGACHLQGLGSKRRMWRCLISIP